MNRVCARACARDAAARESREQSGGSGQAGGWRKRRGPKQRREKSDNNDAFHWVHCTPGIPSSQTQSACIHCRRSAQRERQRELRYSIDFQFLDGVASVWVPWSLPARRAGYQLAPHCSQRYIKRIVFVDSAWIRSNFCPLCQLSPSLSLYFSSRCSSPLIWY